jgi:hypothetical protein
MSSLRHLHTSPETFQSCCDLRKRFVQDVAGASAVWSGGRQELRYVRARFPYCQTAIVLIVLVCLHLLSTALFTTLAIVESTAHCSGVTSLLCLLYEYFLCYSLDDLLSLSLGSSSPLYLNLSPLVQHIA